MKRMISLACVCIVAIAGYAQHKPSNKIGLSIGWQNFKMLDLHASPLTYGTNSIFPKLGLSYNQLSDYSIMAFEISASEGHLNPERFGARDFMTKWGPSKSFGYKVNSSFINANFNGLYMRKINPISNADFNYWVGGTVNESAYYGDAVANMPWIYNTVDISPAVQVNYTPYSSHNIGIKMDFAAIAWVTRAVYALFAKSNRDNNVASFFRQGTKLSSVNKYHKFNLNINYQYNVSAHFAAGAEYRVKWMESKEPKLLRALENSFDMKFYYTY